MGRVHAKLTVDASSRGFTDPPGTPSPCRFVFRVDFISSSFISLLRNVRRVDTDAQKFTSSSRVENETDNYVIIINKTARTLPRWMFDTVNSNESYFDKARAVVQRRPYRRSDLEGIKNLPQDVSGLEATFPLRLASSNVPPDPPLPLAPPPAFLHSVN